MISDKKEIQKNKGRLMKGVVVSDKMNKTVVVAVTRLKEHPKYRKKYKVTKRYKAHDENNEFRVGDQVIIQEIRPISKEKKWRVAEAIRRAGIKADLEEKTEEAKEDLSIADIADIEG